MPLISLRDGPAGDTRRYSAIRPRYSRDITDLPILNAQSMHVLSIFHEFIGTADLEKKRISEPKNDPGRAPCPGRETRSFPGLTAGRGLEAGELGAQSSPGSCLALPVRCPAGHLTPVALDPLTTPPLFLASAALARSNEEDRRRRAVARAKMSPTTDAARGAKLRIQKWAPSIFHALARIQ